MRCCTAHGWPLQLRTSFPHINWRPTWGIVADTGVIGLNLNNYFDTPEEIKYDLRRKSIAEKYGVDLLLWKVFTIPEEAAPHREKVIKEHSSSNF